MSAGDMAYVRERYRVSAKRGAFVRFSGADATIVSAKNGRLNIRIHATGNIWHVHPTWEMEYPPSVPVGAGDPE